MKHCGGSQTDQGEVLDDYCHVTSASGTLHSEGHVITIMLKYISTMGSQASILSFSLSKLW